MSDKHAAVLAAKDKHDQLIKQRNSVNSRINLLKEQSEIARNKHAAACIEIDRLADLNIRGVVSDAELSEKRTAMFSLSYEAGEAAEKADQVEGVLVRVNAELAVVEAEARAALSGCCDELYAAIFREISSDKKLRGKLMELYAAVAASRPLHLQYLASPRWEAILSEAFPEPSDKEVAAAVAEFEAKHKLPAWPV